MSDPVRAAGDDIAAALARVRPRLDDTLVALDFDGTLAPIVARPEDARALPEAPEVLSAVAARVRRVAVVTGRPAADAVDFGGLAAVPGLVVLGHYGLERWQDGVVTTPEPHPGVAVARDRVRALVERAPGVVVEDKGHALALHTRRADDPEGALAALAAPVADLAGEAGLQLTPGRLVLELRPPDVDKGVALRALVQEVSARAVVYAGDDVGDLPALDEIRRLAATGVVGVIVCSDDSRGSDGSGEVSARFRAGADLVVDGPAGVLAVLRELVRPVPVV